MFNKEILEKVLVGYKQRFVNRWKDEKYKWEAIKCFQDNWDINADDFPEMLSRSLEKTSNLLASLNNFPRGMIIQLAGYAPEDVRAMFIDLFDENKDLFERMDAFKNKSEELLHKYSEAQSHYQKENAISTYLWLRYPDRYYIYKYGEVKSVAESLEVDYQFKKGAYSENIRNFMKVYDELNTALKDDAELREMLESSLTDECYPDPELRTLTIDVGFYISREFANEPSDDGKWYGLDYDPGLSIDDWCELLNNREVFTVGSLEIMKRLKDYGGMATCTQLATKYGEKKNFYNSGSVALAKRVCEFTDITPQIREDGSTRWWTVLYIGKDADKDEEGCFIWKLRDELSQALDRVDLSNISLYADKTIRIWKISHGANQRGVPDEYKKVLRDRNVVVVDEVTGSKGVSKISQGDDFKYTMKKGDYFYLCYGNSIQLFGQITSDNAIANPELKESWLERNYRVIKECIGNPEYNGVNKWWTPNNNSTCIQVDDLDLFESLILKPYFDLELDDIMSEQDLIRNYWWLNANPRMWSFSDLKIGEVQNYTLYNENGNKRKIFQHFMDAKVGDMVIGYESHPVKQVVAIARVSKEQDGESLYFEKVEGLVNPIDYETLKECSELEKMEYFKNPQGSLFKLTKGEYDFILDIIREENPIKLDESVEKYSKKDFLDEVFMSEEKYNKLVALLENKKNIILQGAPGVGKTFAAKRLAWSIMGEKDNDRIEFVQFHQNYSYEDFMMGYKPVGDGFELKQGIFYRFCKKAENQPDKRFFFIIDEINRGNLSKIFGELLMMIEEGYRDTKVTLAYNGMPFSVPSNLYIIGMMNTADRSLAMIDYALRRRFSFVEISPGFDSEGFIEYKKKLNNETFNELISKIEDLNKAIALDNSLGKGFCIGHSYFCGKDSCTDEWLQLVVDFDIIPMIEEYWFDDENSLMKWKNILKGVF